MTSAATSLLTAAVVVSGALIALAAAEDRPHGAVASTNIAEICATDGRPGSAYSRAHRVVKRKPVPGHQVDHIVPLCLGGADADANIQIQPIEEAIRKDRLEVHACRQVCRGLVPLASAQGWFLGDWRSAYAREFDR